MSGVYEKKLDSVEFYFYTPDESKSLGMVEVTLPDVYDLNKLPNLGGLGDPSMGVSPGSSSQVPCSTCSQDVNTCPGHLGYMPLSTVVFNPFTLDLTYKLLKSKCSFCHRLRVTPEASRVLLLKSKLLKHGKFLDSLSIEDLLADKNIKANSDKDLQEIKNIILDEKDFIEEIAEASTEEFSEDFTAARTKLANEVRSQLWKMFSATCPHCEQKQVKIRKEGDCKLIRDALKEK
jgi:DNA-directed RNA polymerase I subunit RPA1